jgi:hypothetical protein
MGKIIWLASYPKSGNTWLRIFLHNYILLPESPHSINALADLAPTECSLAFFQPHHPNAATLTPAETQKLRPKIHRHLTTLSENHIFLKTHNANLAYHGIPLCTPSLTAGAITVIRDPRDIAVSYAAYTGKSLDDTIALMNQKAAANAPTPLQVFELLSTWSAHVSSWTQSKIFLPIRYEDMLATPHATFAKIVTFLGETPDPTRLQRAIDFSAFPTLSAQEQRDGYAAHAPTAATPFFRAGHPGQWRTTLTKAQAQRIEHDHAEAMKKFGYT